MTLSGCSLIFRNVKYQFFNKFKDVTYLSKRNVALERYLLAFLFLSEKFPFLFTKAFSKLRKPTVILIL